MPAVIPLDAASSGDLVFMHSSGMIGRAIRLAEEIRWRRGSSWNHVAILDQKTLTGWTLIQADAPGVTRGGPLTGEYSIVQLPVGVDRARVLQFARAQVGRKYGFVTIVSILVSILTPRFFNVMWPNTWICSALGAESLRFGGWLKSWPDIYTVSPAELWEVL
jgi:hypothetical protein